MAHIHLFGIMYAREMESMSLADLVIHASIPKSYATEVNKGKNLVKYVEVKQ